MNSLLEGYTVLDFSYRLPGPLAGKILREQGARVIKVEDEKFQDPFIKGLFAEMDDSFSDWYQELNQSKEVLRFDFSSEEDQNKLKEMALNSDAIIMGIPTKVQEKIGITKGQLSKKLGPLAVVEIHAAKEGKSALHDLNALAENGLLTHHVADNSLDRVPPPFLPVAGIGFGQQIANDLLAALLRSQKVSTPVFVDSYLFESTYKTFSSFYPETQKNKGRTKFLHNGLYPCYNIYKTKDDRYVALAAVEDKFWETFCRLFDINLASAKRFHHQDNQVFKVIEDTFKELHSDQIAKLIENQECCLSLI